MPPVERIDAEEMMTCVPVDGVWPAPPPQAIELIELSSHPDARLSALASLIERDESLVHLTLSICNSAAFRMGGRAKSVEQLAIFLGIQQIKSVVLSIMLLRAAGPGDMAWEGSESPLERAAYAATAACAMADRVQPLLTGEAFVGGVVQDIGAAVLGHRDPGGYRSVMDAVCREHKRRHDAEQRVLGTTHMHEGAAVLRAWSFAESIHVPVAHHHHPQSFDGDVQLSSLVTIQAVAGEVARYLSHPEDTVNRGRVFDLCAGAFRFSSMDISSLLESIARDAAEVSAALDSAVGPIDAVAPGS